MASTLVQKIRNVGRLTQIVNIFARHGFKKELQRTELGDFLTPEGGEAPNVRGGSLAHRLVLAFEELGPTFVKLGQLLASREDLLPRHVISELKRLQDRAKPFSPDVLEKILTTEFGSRRESLFASVDPVPLGAASIGQVHRAVLADGRDVVIKVQRPEVEPIIKTDLSILMGVASILESAFPELRGLRLTVVVDELSRSLQAELDYFREAANTERIRHFFAGHERIYIPAVYRDYCTASVLCLEAIKGTKLTQLPEETHYGHLVDAGVGAFLDMTFKFGMFHADLHPGNFILMEDGKLAILDFGLTARLSREIRETLSFMFLALVQEDLETFSRLFIDLTDASVDVDRRSLEAEIRDAVDTAFSMPLRQLQLGRCLMQVARISAVWNAPVSRELVLFFRALVALESFGRTLDPDFQVMAQAASYAQSLPRPTLDRAWFEKEAVFVFRDLQVLLRELPLTLRLFSKRAQTGNFVIRVQADDMVTLAREVDRASNRLSLALILAGLLLAASILTYGKTGPLFDSLATLGLIGFGVAGFLGVAIIVGILRSGRYR